jgi:hypothetical protein
MTLRGRLSLGDIEMAYEQILTILLGAGVGVAAVLYAVRSRLFGASRSIVSGGSSIETFTVSSQSTSVSQTDAAPIPKVTATPPPVVEAPVAKFLPLSFGAAIDAPTVSSTAASVPVGSQAARAARAPRAPRRSAGAPRAHKPRAAGQPAQSTKAPDEPSL